MAYPNPNEALRGLPTTLCFRRACRRPYASHWNWAMGEFYCTSCAGKINDECRRTKTALLCDWPAKDYQTEAMLDREQKLHDQVFDSNVSDREYFEQRRAYHEARASRAAEFRGLHPKVLVSAGICGSLTFGKADSDLDHYGYWDDPDFVAARDYERLFPEDGKCWPFDEETLAEMNPSPDSAPPPNP